eukprot:symbB.v1.2.005225.t1/scaffold293.1/size237565/6
MGTRIRDGWPWQLPLQLLHLAKDRRLRFDVIVCSAALSACEKGPRWEVAVELLDWMRQQPGLQPNLICFGAAISVGLLKGKEAA